MTTVRCESCETPFEHPGFLADCVASAPHRCEHLAAVGWHNVSVRVVYNPTATLSPLLFVRGGWLCAACSARYDVGTRGPPR